MLTFCTQWRFIPSKRRYQLYSTIKLVRYYPNSPHLAVTTSPWCYNGFVDYMLTRGHSVAPYQAHGGVAVAIIKPLVLPKFVIVFLDSSMMWVAPTRGRKFVHNFAPILLIYSSSHIVTL